MRQRFINVLIAISLLLVGSLTLVPAVASADFKADACQGVNTLNGTVGSNCNADADKTVNKIIKAVIQVFSVIVGFVAVIMIIVGGIKYVTSGGDSGAVSSAKNTIIYALIGLVVVAVAQVLVHFVIFKTGNALKL